MNRLTGAVFGLLFSIIGILFYFGKLHGHFSVWKNMSEADRNTVRIKPLCRNVGAVILLAGLIFLCKGIIRGFSDRWFVLSMVGWLVLAGADVWYIGKSRRYRQN